jgi:glycosyltransferase involved in cell wall biosynthesis
MPGAIRVAYLVRSWPRLSQTFVLNEVINLERVGVSISIFAMTRANEERVQPQLGDVAASVEFLDAPVRRRVSSHLRVIAGAPWRYMATLAFALTRRQLLGGYTKSSGLSAFKQAVLVADAVFAQQRERPFTHIHAHFAHDPALIGLLVHRLTNLPFTFTAHARDIYQISDRAFAGRAHEASAVVTCCRANVEHLLAVLGSEAPVELIYHGIDLRMFRPAVTQERNGVPLIVSVGRLVEKKGYDSLLRACAQLAADGVAFRCEIYGEGPLRAELEALRNTLGLGETVFFPGERTQAELVPVYQHADIFALTPRVTSDGDRDGMPNVIVEAMACGIPVVTTQVVGTAEIVTDGRDGLLAPVDDIHAIAACLARLLRDAPQRRRFGEAAVQSSSRFDVRNAAVRLAALFDDARGAAA